MNSEIILLEEGIVKLLNESKLPIEVKRLVLVELLGKVTEARNTAIQAERSMESKGKEVKLNEQSS